MDNLSSNWFSKNKLLGYLFLAGVFIAVVGVVYLIQNPVQKSQPVIQERKDSTADWKTYTNTKYGFEIKYPPTWKVIADDPKINSGLGVWINPPDFKMPESGTVNPYFEFNPTAHMYLGDEEPIIRQFGTRNGYVYVKDQSVYFPESQSTGGYYIKLYTPNGVDEPNQILSTFKFTGSADATADWKTINMTGAIFMVPAAWGIVNEESGNVSPINGGSYSADTAISVGELGSNPPAGGFMLNIYDDTNYKRSPGETFIQSLVKLYQLKDTSKTNVNFGSYTAINYTSQGSNYTILDLGNRVVEVQSYRIGLNELQQILSTFKFTK